MEFLYFVGNYSHFGRYQLASSFNKLTEIDFVKAVIEPLGISCPAGGKNSNSSKLFTAEIRIHFSDYNFHYEYMWVDNYNYPVVNQVFLSQDFNPL